MCNQVIFFSILFNDLIKTSISLSRGSLKCSTLLLLREFKFILMLRHTFKFYAKHKKFIMAVQSKISGLLSIENKIYDCVKWENKNNDTEFLLNSNKCCFKIAIKDLFKAFFDCGKILVRNLWELKNCECIFRRLFGLVLGICV